MFYISCEVHNEEEREGVVEKLVMFGKPIRKHPTSKVKDVQKMLQWIKMEPTKYKWVR